MSLDRDTKKYAVAFDPHGLLNTKLRSWRESQVRLVWMIDALFCDCGSKVVRRRLVADEMGREREEGGERERNCVKGKGEVERKEGSVQKGAFDEERKGSGKEAFRGEVPPGLGLERRGLGPSVLTKQKVRKGK